MAEEDGLGKVPADAFSAKDVEHLRLVLERAGLGTFEHHLGSSIVHVSRLTCELYGVAPRHELPLGELLAQVDPSALSDRERTFAQVLAGERDFYELRYRVGRPLFPRWLSVRGRVVFDEDAPPRRRPIRVVGVVADITAQVEQQQQMQQARAMLDAIGNSTDAFMYVKDRQGRMLYCNAAVFRALGKQPEDVIGHTDLEFLGDHPETRAIQAHDAEVMRTGHAEKYREVLVPSNRVYVSTKTPFRDVFGETIGLAGVSMDITELHQVRQALQDTEELATLATEAAQIGVYEWDPVSDSLTWSAAMRQQFGVDSSGPVTLAAALAKIHPDDRTATEKAISNAMKPGSDGHYESVYRTIPREGEVRWLHVLGRVRFESRGGQEVAVRFAGISIDTTRQKGRPTSTER